MPKEGLFMKCALPFLFMCGLTLAAVGPAFSRSALEADGPHSEPALSAPNQSAGTPVNHANASPETGTAPKIGDRMPDGVLYAGVSPYTRRPTYTTPADAPGLYSWKKSAEYCYALKMGVHHGWRVPTKGELHMLFQSRDAIGGFDISGSYPAGWYWSSSQFDYDSAWDQRFSDGNLGIDLKLDGSSVRCVR
jgi:hypothetical protein